MPPDAIASSHATIERAAPTLSSARNTDKEDAISLYEHVAWVYAFCREHVFRDDTQRIIGALWPNGRPRPGTKLIELGCGPGFYSCRLAERFPDVFITGVDCSESQLQWARNRAETHGLNNCSFKRVNVLQLACADREFHMLLASRLFTILPEPGRAIAEMYRVLKPGGRCFIAEPRHGFRASIPLFAMWLFAGMTRFQNGYREPRQATVFSAQAFGNLFPTQPWKEIKIWQEGAYQYAVCEKDGV